jgi:GrpE
MHHQIARLVTNLILSSLKATPTPTPGHATPAPTTIVHYVPVLNSGNGLNTIFYVLVILLLAGVSACVIWMFGTGRWVSVKGAEAYAATTRTDRLPPGSKAAKATPGAQDRQATPEPEQVVASAGAAPNPPQAEDPLKNKRWIALAEGCTELFNELDGRYPPSDARYEVANHTLHRLQVVLRRSGVEMLIRDRAYDPKRHQLVPPDPAVPPGTSLARVISPGFAIGSRVLRPAKVQIAHFGEADQGEKEDG